MVKQKYELIPLQWDTDYFGINSARVNLKNMVDNDEQSEIINFCRGYEFVTIFNNDNKADNNTWLGQKTNGFLTDMNVQFTKTQTKKNNCYIDGVYVTDTPSKIREITHIAKESFLYSRFFNDDNLPTDKSENIYIHWINTALKDKNKFFVIAEEDEIVTGFLLFSITRNICVIELIAVNQEYQGKKIGKKIIQQLENHLFEKSIYEIKVGTQINNIPAINFYTKMGFQYVSCGSIYHLWSN